MRIPKHTCEGKNCSVKTDHTLCHTCWEKKEGIDKLPFGMLTCSKHPNTQPVTDGVGVFCPDCYKKQEEAHGRPE